MTIQFHSEEITNYDPMPAISHWYNPQRRMNMREASSVEYNPEQEQPAEEVQDILAADVAALGSIVSEEFSADSDYDSEFDHMASDEQD